MSKNRRKVGILGIAIGSLGLIILVFLFFNEVTYSLTIMEEKTTIILIYFTGLLTGGLAIIFGLLEFSYRENIRVAYLSIILGICVAAFPFIKAQSILILISLIVSGILANVGSPIEK